MRPNNQKTGRMTHNEIQSALEHEKNPDLRIPKDAHSEFRFEIEENISDLVKEMTKTSKKHYPQERTVDEMTGEVSFSSDRKTPYKLANYKKEGDVATYELEDENFNSWASVRQEKDKIEIETAWGGYHYTIQQNKDNDGCSVKFAGPLNGLMRQQLLPNMTYKPHTLEGKFVSSDGKKDITPYIDIDRYCQLRAQKNGDEKNMQDEYGARINSYFNNEIPAFKTWEKRYAQDIKNNKAQREFEEGRKIFSEYRKEHVKDRLKRLQKLTPEIREGMETTTKSGYKHVSRTPAPTKGQERE